jgi:hypothetical protein
MVQRHDGADDVEPADRPELLDPLPDQPRALRRLWIDTDSVEAARRQALDEPAVAAADVEHPGAGGDGIDDDRVEAAPPAIVAHLARGLSAQQPIADGVEELDRRLVGLP